MAMSMALEYYLEQGTREESFANIRRKAEELSGYEVETKEAGMFLGSYGIPKRMKQGSTLYNIGVIIDSLNSETQNKIGVR